MNILTVIGRSLFAAAGMFWSIFWALILGFAISGAVQAFVPKKRMGDLLGKPGIKQLGLATFFGAVSSSCSYAAAAMARTLFQKGAHIIPALAFMVASTNLVLELSIVLWALMGWRFVLAEFIGGIILVAVMALLMQLFGPLKAFEERRKGLKREHSPHDDSIETEEKVADPRTLEGWRKAARGFVMEGRMIWKDIVLGVVLSGFLMVLVPDSFWRSLFLQRGAETAHQFALGQLLENATVGPLVSMLSFVCSIGNIPLAGVLYQGGITFGGALSFIYADLIVIPLILIYRKYYGGRLALCMIAILYLSMVITGVIVDLLFTGAGLVPEHTGMPTGMSTGMPMMGEMHFFRINYTFWLNSVFLIVAIILIGLAKSGGEEQKKCHSCAG